MNLLGIAAWFLIVSPLAEAEEPAVIACVETIGPPRFPKAGTRIAVAPGALRQA